MSMSFRHFVKSTESVIANGAINATYTGAGAAMIGFLAADTVTAVLGATVAVGGFITNWYYRYKEDKRRQREHEMRLREHDIAESAGEE